MPIQHTVQEGDCMSSLAEQTGHFWETIWNDPANEQLKRDRKDPNILNPGDLVEVPDKRRKEVTKDPEAKHRFRRKGVPSKLRLRVLVDGEPVANEDYRIDIDGKITSGKTDGDGNIEVWIPGTAQRGMLYVGSGENALEYELHLGRMHPIETVEGVQMRLKNLGYMCEITGKIDLLTENALADFQAAHEMEVTGQLNSATRDKLKEVHGS